MGGGEGLRAQQALRTHISHMVPVLPEEKMNISLVSLIPVYRYWYFINKIWSPQGYLEFFFPGFN